jgi:4-aminobutyrate aminotransferase-like enzyme
LAAACETVRVIRDEGLAENAARMGEHLQTRLRALQTKYPTIGEVRGRGLMTATEFTRDGEPDKTTAKAVAKYCIDHKLLLMTCGPYENVIRWIPPLIVTKEQMDGALTIFESALKHVLETA